MLSWDEEQEGIFGEISGECTEQIDIKMLMNNKIPGFLPLQIRYVDNIGIYYYPAAGLVPLERLLDERVPDTGLVRGIYEEICRACHIGEEFFLKMEHFVLDIAYMMWDTRKEELQICYFPGYAVSMNEQVEQLSELLLQKIDHSDKESVLFSYGLYDMVVAGGFVLPAVEKYLKESRDCAAGEAGLEWEKEPSDAQDGLRHADGALQEDKTGADAQKVKSSPFLLQNVSGNRWIPDRILLFTDSVLVGRSPGEHGIVIPAMQISRRHALLETEEGGVFLSDLCSKNGSFLNHKKMPADHPVLCREGDEITFADISYRLIRQTVPDRPDKDNPP